MKDDNIININKIGKIKEIDRLIKKVDIDEDELSKLIEMLSDNDIEKIVRERYGI